MERSLEIISNKQLLLGNVISLILDTETQGLSFKLKVAN